MDLTPCPQISCFTDVSVMFVGISGVDLGLLDEGSQMLWGEIIMAITQVDPPT